MKSIQSIVVLIVSIIFPCLSQAAKSNDLYKGIEFDMPKVVVPTFPERSVSITEFGAVGDGQTMNTDAIAKAIHSIAAKGGGRVVIPRGIWLTGPIILKSNIDLHVESGALVVFSKDKDHYPLIETSFEGLDTVRCTSPIYGKGLSNIAITGDGTIDGSGEVWRKVKKEKMTEKQWKELLKSGGYLGPEEKIWYPSEQYMLAAQKSGNVPTYITTMKGFESVRDLLRPVMVSLVECDKVLLDGPVFQNSPAWNIHPLMCTNLTVRNIDVGDDAICIKSGRNEDGRKRGIPTRT